jgi:hypothetical protein
MKYICTNRRDCVLQDRDNTVYCGQPTRECGFKEPAEDRQKALRDLSDGWRRAERDEKVGRLVRAAREVMILFNIEAYRDAEGQEFAEALNAFAGEYESPEGQEGG